MEHRLYLRIKTSLAMVLILSFIVAVSGCSWAVTPSDTSHTSGKITESSAAETDNTTQPETSLKPSTDPTTTLEPTPEPTSAPTSEPTTEPTGTPTPTPAADLKTYTVKSGDTLFSIAVKYGVTAASLTKINNLSDPGMIYVGQILLIPASDDTPVPSSYDSLDNTGHGWSYNVPSPLYQDIAATLPASSKALVDKYDAVWQLVQKDKKVIYITMDAGYEYGTNTTKILDTAKDKNVRITFFVTGSYINNNPAVVLRMVNERHTVANHTERHLNQPIALNTSLGTLQDDITKAEQRFENLTGKSFALYLRPPEGVYSERSLAVLRDMGYKAVFWSFAYADWQTDKQPDPDMAYEKIMGQLHNGSVLLLHTVSDTNTQILGRLIDGIRARGYSIELLP